MFRQGMETGTVDVVAVVAVVAAAVVAAGAVSAEADAAADGASLPHDLHVLSSSHQATARVVSSGKSAMGTRKHNRNRNRKDCVYELVSATHGNRGAGFHEANNAEQRKKQKTWT